MTDQKENDMLLNVMENPSFSIQDFQDIGLNVQNTSLQSKDVYQNSPQIQENTLFQDSKGNFDPTKFATVYNTAAKVYNTMATTAQNQDSDFKVQYSKYNIFAPEQYINPNPDFSIDTHSPNPDQRTSSIVRVGEVGPREKTPAELAESHKVYNPATGEWEASPEDSFFDNLFHVRALAQYDEDVDINGKKRGEAGFDENNIEHAAGELKINPDTGTYYYEDIDGQNIHNKQLLHLSDVFTKEGSYLNSIDFFDSDDIHKTPIGSFVKNAALVGSMFIPYVGPWITGATIVQQAASMGATLGKIFTGSDNKAFNFIQGAAEQSDPFRTRSEYSQQNMWTMENLFGMIGDTVAQLKQQRMLFEQLPKLIGKDGRVLTQKGQDAMTKELAAKYDLQNAKAIQDKYKMPMQQLAKENFLEYNNATEQLRLMNQNKAAADLENYVKDYYNTGSILSKAYMTLLTVNDTYDQAKQAGASDTLAALTTLGYASAEYALLSTGLGEWVMPELRANRMQNKALLKALTKDTIKSFEIEGSNATTTEAKHAFWNKVINFGKKIFNADYAVGRQNTLAQTAASTFAAATGEGFEEVSEDVLQDFVNTMYNLYQDSVGADPKNRMHNTDWGSQYMMDFLGGFLGGGIANATLNFRTAKENNNLTAEKAAQKLVYMMRNPEQLNDFYKVLEKTDVGNKYLSATKTIQDENGNIIGYEQGTKEDNQDKAAKDLVRQNINLIKNTLEADGGNISDKSLFDANTLKDLHWQYLYNSTTTARLIQNFNDLNVKALKLHNEISQLNHQLPDQKYKKENAEKSENKTPTDQEISDIQDQITAKQEQLKDIRQQIDDIKSGKKAALFMAPALLETSPYVLDGFLKSATFEGFAELKEGKSYKDISTDRLEQLKSDYNNYINTYKKDDIDIATREYLNATNLFSENFQNIESTYTKLGEDKTILSNLQAISSNLQFLSGIQDSDAFLENSQKVTNMLNSIDWEEYGSPVTKYNELLESLNSGEITNEEFKPKVIQLLNDTKTKLVTLLQKQANRYIDAGNIPASIKSTLMQQLQYAANMIGGLAEDTGDFSIKMQEQSTIIKLWGLKSKIKKLPYTPIFDIADNYISTVYGGNEFKISDLFNTLTNLENQSKEDISQFILKSDLDKQITQADIVLNQLMSIAEGARTDDASLVMFDNNLKPKDNIWGINKTLNDVAKASGDKEWEELPTISTPVADALLADIVALRAKLQYYKTLSGINKGQKLNGQNRISLHTAYLYYKQVKRLADVVPDDWNKTALTTVFPKLNTLEEYSNKNTLTLDKDTSIEVRKQQILMEDAIYQFFQDNKDKNLEDLFKQSSFNIITNKSTLLTETTDDIDNVSFVGWLASKAAIKSSVFYKSILEIIPTSKLVPLDTQLQSVQLSVANIVNGNLISKFSEVAKNAALSYLNNLSIKDRFTFLKSQGYNDSVAALYATNDGKKLLSNTPLVSRFDNIILVTGVPGAGKSSGVFKLTADYLKKYYPNVLDDAWVCHTSVDKAKGLRSNIGLSDGQNFDKETLLTKISTWSAPKNIDTNGDIKDSKDRLILSADGGITSKYNLKTVIDKPKVIFIDEVSRFTQDELDLIDDFAKVNGISVVTAGDFSQSQTSYIIPLNEIFIPSKINALKKEIQDNGLITDKELGQLGKTIYTTEVANNNILHTPKIGASIRTANSQQDLNQQTFLAAMEARAKNPKNPIEIKLHYFENERELLGSKRVESKDVAEVTKELDKLIPKLAKGEKIGYVYFDTESPIYKELSSKPKYWDHIQTYKGNSAQGSEGNYWIIETNPKKSDDNILKDIYTGITRASKGSLLVLPADFNRVRDDRNIEISDIQDKETQILSFRESDKKRFSDKYLSILKEALTSFADEENPAYINRDDHTGDTSTDTGDDSDSGEDSSSSGDSDSDDSGDDSEDDSDDGKKKKPTPPPTPGPTPPPAPASVGTGPTLPAASKSFSDWLNDEGKKQQEEIDKINKDDLDAQIQLFNRLKDSRDKLDETTTTDYSQFVDYYNKLLKDVEDTIDKLKRKQAIDTVPNIDFNKATLTQRDNLYFLTIENVSPLFINKILQDYDNTYNLLDSDEQFTSLTLQYNRDTDDIIISAANSKGDGQILKTSLSNIYNVGLQQYFSNIKNTPIVTTDTVTTPGKKKKKVAKDEKLDNDESGKQPKEEKTTDKSGKNVEHLSYMLDTSKTFETGWIDNGDGTFRPEDPDMEGKTAARDGKNAVRIDGFNGLFNPDGSKKIDSLAITDIPTNGSSKEAFKKAIDLIAKLRMYAFTTKNKEDLIKKIIESLQLQENANGAYITFGVKSSYLSDKYDPKNNFRKFGKSSNESILFSDNSDTYNHYLTIRNLVIIIGWNGQDKLEIPLLKLNSPISKLQSLGEINKTTGKHEGYTLWESQLNGNNGDIPAAIDNLLNNWDSIPLLKNKKSLKSLFTLYRQTYKVGTMLYIHDNNWTPANNLIDMGPQYNVSRGDTYGNDLQQDSKEYILSEIAKRPDIKMSNIMSYTGRKIYLNSDGSLSEDAEGKTEVEIISNPGHPFILYTTDPELTSDKQLLDQFISQKVAKAKGEKYDAKVHIKYVTTPEISIEQYIQSVLNFTTTDKNVREREDIFGNDKTSYLVLKSLFLDEHGNAINKKELISLLQPNWGKSGAEQIYNFLLDKIQYLDSLDQDSLLNELNTAEDWSKDDSTLPKTFGYKNKSISQQFMTVIRQLVAPMQIINNSDEGLIVKWAGELNQTNENIIIDLFNKSGNKIYFQARLANSSDSDISTNSGLIFKYIKTQRNNPYQVAYSGSINIQKDFKIFGNIGTNMYLTDDSFEDILNGFISKLKLNKQGKYYSSDNTNYVNGYSQLNYKSPTEANSYNSTITELKKKYTFLQFSDPKKPNDSLHDSDIKTNMISAFQNGYAFIPLNDKILMVQFDKSFDVADIQGFDKFSGQGNFKIVTKDNKIYTIEYNPSNNSVTYTDDTPKVETPQEPMEIGFPDIVQYNDVYQYIYNNILNSVLAGKGRISQIVNESIQNKDLDTFIKKVKTITVKNKLINSIKQFNFILQNGDYDYDQILSTIDPDKKETAKQILRNILEDKDEGTSCVISHPNF